MRIVDRGLLALLALLVAAPSVHAARCTDTSGFEPTMDAVEAVVPCASATKHKKYVKDAKRALGSMLTGPCKKAFVKRFLANSTCGRPSGFEVCCDANNRGKDISKVVKSGRCKGQVCTASRPQSVGEGCTATGTCIPTTTTTTTSSTSSTSTSSTRTTSTSTSTTSSTTTSTMCPFDDPALCPTTTTTSTTIPTMLDFTSGLFGGVCGETRDGSGNRIKTLTCAGLSIGGGGSIVLENPSPDGAINRFTLSCTPPGGPSCTIGPFTTPPAPNSADPDCTNTGCNFGAPLEVPNPTEALTSCTLNTWSEAASGMLDLAAGTSSTNVRLSSAVFLTGNSSQPCPRCSATGDPAVPGGLVGSPGSPQSGFCNRGRNQGQPCTTTNSIGLTRDCPTGPDDLGSGVPATPAGVLDVNLSPLTTSTVTVTQPTGFFCPGQDQVPPPKIGCFNGAGSENCRTIIENGTPAGPITPGTPATATLASVFCIPATSNIIVNSTAKLPGPGALSLPGTFVVR